MGRQAQMIPVFASIVVQMVELRLPNVWSLDFELTSSVVILRTDVIQTLEPCKWEP